MQFNNNLFKFLCILLFIPIFLGSCKDDDLDVQLFQGLWVQEQITEDGQVVPLSDQEKNLKLLIENNGIYRTYTTDGINPVTHFGTWIVTDDKWIDFNIETWYVRTKPAIKEGKVQDGAWGYNTIPARLSILSISNEKMEIRIKTYAGEKKYSPLFVAHERPQITFDNIDDIVKEYKVLKTYIFTFKKSSNLQH